MDCCSWAKELDRLYDEKTARDQVKEYREGYLRPETRILVNELRAAGVEGATLLDVGGGVGVVQHELVASGVSRVTDVDAARAYLRAAQAEGQRLGYAERATYVHGDFVALASTVAPADIVTLDRVLCCYPNMDALVRASADHARRLYGLVYPRDAWWVRLQAAAKNAWNRITRNPDRDFIHGTGPVEELLRQRGFRRRFLRRKPYWQVAIYERYPGA